MIAAGLYQPTSGRVAIGGAHCRRTEPRGGHRVPEGTSLLEWRTILHNLLLPIEVEAAPRVRPTWNAPRSLLRMVGLSGFESSYPGQLSLRQCGSRAGHLPGARARSAAPASRRAVRVGRPAQPAKKLGFDLLRPHRCCIGKTVIFVTHSVEEAVAPLGRGCW